MTQRFCFDVESTSECDLKTAGAAAYWQHPSTQIICVKYRIDKNPIQTWRPGDAVPHCVHMGFLFNGLWRVVAHNFLFEYNCWLHVLWRFGWGQPPGFQTWDCTMARALYWGLPAGLIDVCAALGLSVQIDTAKKARIKRMGKPRGYDALGDPVWWHETDTDKLRELLEDCETDVLAECELDDALPALPAREREIFEIDAEINQLGISIDLPLVDKLDTLTQSEGARLNAEMARLTNNRVTSCNQGAKIITELAFRGVDLLDLTKATVGAVLARVADDLAIYRARALPMPLMCEAEQILLTRQEAAKASTAKLTAMRRGVSPDGRARGLFQYCGAGRTHRWAARRIQPQNMPRGSVKGLGSLYRLIERGFVTAAELAPLLPGTVMDAVSSMLRGCLVASNGYLLVSADLSQIEARLTAWYGGQQDILDIFASGEDVYTYTARKVGSDNRQLGKVLVLACGFGMGPAKFKDTAETYGVFLTMEEAEEYVRLWRELNHKTVSFWWDCDRAFRRVAEGAHLAEERVGRVIFRKTRKAVRIILPSGGELVYHNVELRDRGDGSGRDEITFMGVDPKTKRWSFQRTYGGKIVENIVQATDREILAEAMIAHRRLARGAVAGTPLIAKALRLLGNMHDELLGEAPADMAQAALDFLLRIMRTTPAWAPGLPVSAEGWIGPRYKK